MGSIVPFKGNTLPDFLIASDGVDNEEFSHGAGEGFGVLSFRGKVWRLKHKGEEHVLTKGGEPITRLNVVLLRANKSYSKIFYAKKYAEGDDAAPDCFSADGEVPDPSAAAPQAKQCSVCPNNAWGSRITDDGRKAKACQDSRRMAVLLVDPALDIMTDEPVLLRVPPASLGELKTYADGMAKAGVPLWKIITQVGFDLDSAYPKLLFKAFGWDEGQIENWRGLREGDVVERILHSSAEAAPTTKAASAVRAPVVDADEQGEDEDEDEGESPPSPPPASKAKETTPSKPRKAAVKAAPKKPEPEVEEVEHVSDDVNLDDIVNGLLGS